MALVGAYGYVRVSGKGQVEGDGFRRQEDTIRAYAQKAGYSIAHVYQEEGISGTTTEDERPAFKDMVNSILSNGVRTIIIESMDRLARQYAIQEQLMIYLASKGITLICARTEENVTESMLGDPMKKALIQIQGVFAELEKSMLVKKLRSAREQVKQVKGKCEGRKSLKEVNPEVVSIIKKLRHTKPGQKSRSYAKIADELNSKGYTTVSGKKWTATNVQNVCQRF